MREASKTLPIIKYSQEWLAERALKSITKISDGLWDFKDSLSLYGESGEAVYTTIHDENSLYFKMVTKPERDQLEAVADQIAQMLSDNFEYIDLGPGTDGKEKYLFDALKKMGKKFTYRPVDIAKNYLELAERNAKSRGIPVNPIRASFEELPDILEKPSLPRFVSLGMTFANFDPQECVSLLNKISSENGFIFINLQLRDRMDIKAMQRIYQENMDGFLADKIKLLGLDQMTDVSDIKANDKIEVWCTIKHANDKLKKIGIRDGDKMLMFQSIRYTKDSIIEELEKSESEYEMIDNGGPIVALIIRF